MYKTVLVLLLTCLSLSGLQAQSQWNNALYQRYTHKNFERAKVFNSPIDLQNVDYRLLNAAIFYLTNQQRVENGLEPLSFHPTLEVAAWNHSLHMGQNDFFSHYNTGNPDRKTPTERARLAGIANPYMSENIYMAYNYRWKTYMEAAQYFVQGWMDSPGHRSNILSPKGLSMGCGVYYVVAEKRWYATQNFQWYKPLEVSTEAPVDQIPNQG